jgi:hypothetical protein
MAFIIHSHMKIVIFDGNLFKVQATGAILSFFYCKVHENCT